MFCCWSFIRISNWNDSIWRPGRICGAQRRKFVKNQMGPKWSTCFEVWNEISLYSKAPSAWYWQKNKSLKYLPEKFNLAMDFWSWSHAVNKRNVWNKDNWTRSSLVLVQNSLHISETFKTLKGNLTDLFSFLLSNQTLIMIMLTNIHIWICLVFKKSQGSPMNAVP